MWVRVGCAPPGQAVGVAGEGQDERRYVLVRERELGPSLWDESEDEGAEPVGFELYGRLSLKT